MSGGGTVGEASRWQRVMVDFWSQGGQRHTHPAGTVIHHPAADGHPLGTFVRDVRSADGQLLGEVLTGEAVPAWPRPVQVIIDAETPAAAEARLALEGWHLETMLLLVLGAGTEVPRPDETEPLRRVETEDDWAAIESLFRIDHLEEDRRTGAPERSAEATRAAVALRRGFGAEVAYHLVGGAERARGCIAAWPGPDGIGLIEDVFVHPDARGAGVATRMLQRMVHYLRGRGAEEIVIGAEIADTPKHLYHRFGFRPGAVMRGYLREVAS